MTTIKFTLNQLIIKACTSTKEKFMYLISWYKKGWPLWFILLFLSIHFITFKGFHPSEEYRVYINKIIIVMTQILGGCLILYEINKKLSFYEIIDPLKLIADYLREPFFRKPVIIQPESSVISVTCSTARICMTGHSQNDSLTDMEKIEILQKQIEEIQMMHVKEKLEIQGEFDKIREKILEGISMNSKVIEKHSELLKKISIGGTKRQIFGVFLFIYGSLLRMI